jgi:nucleoid DNA-binding protein
VAAPGEIDRDRLRAQVEGIFTALSEALAKIHEVHDQTIGAFERLDATDREGTEPVQRIRLVG